MGTPRKLAAALLRAALRVTPRASREWVEAMLCELEFVPGEWAALFWALGSVGAILRHVAMDPRQWMTRFNSGQEGRMNSTGKKAVGIVSGAISAVMFAGCAFALLRLADLLFPRLGIAGTEWTHWLVAIIIPEAVFLAAAVLLWRKKGPVAVGILLTAIAIGLHFVVHLAGHHG